MNDFFERQDVARRNSLLLAVYFILAVGVITALISIVATILLSFDPQRLYYSVTPLALSPAGWDLSLLATISAATLVFICCGSLYKYYRLRSGGGGMIAEMLGGRIVFPDTMDVRERRLLNIVEEMSIASGVTVPTVYVMEGEFGINAFAAGFSPEDAVVGVTRGALLYLSREELQGVIAHEFSHILYGDMRINIRLQGILHGILLIGLLGESLIRSAFMASNGGSGRRSNKDGGGILLVVLGLVLFILGYTGVFFGKLIKSAISRQREFLADAAAVQFTRNPLGLAGALKKIGGLDRGSKLRSPKAVEVNHMFFGNGFANSWFAHFSTHPPLEERIRRLDPSFMGTFPAKVQQVTVDDDLVAQAVDGVGTSAGHRQDAPLSRQRVDAGLRNVIGNPTAEHMALAGRLLESLPPGLRAGVRNGFGARAVVWILLLDKKEAPQRKQLEVLQQDADPRAYKEFEKLLPHGANLPAEVRLPLLDLAIPTLKTLSDQQYNDFKKIVLRLIRADSAINLFEYGLQYILLKHLDGYFYPKRMEQKAEIDSLVQAGRELSCVLSLLARIGHVNEAETGKAFMKAIRSFPEKDRKHFELLPDAACNLQHFDAALGKLVLLRMPLKEQVLAACLESIVCDEQVIAREAELFRIIAEAMNCPIPPWLTAYGAIGL